MNHFRGYFCAVDFTEGARKDVHHACEDYSPIGEDLEFKSRAADYEEQYHNGACPAIHAVHKLLREVAEVAEHRTHHHADEQRREADGNGADLELKHGECDGEEDVCNGDAHSLAAGMEELLGEVEEQTHERAENEGDYDFYDRIYEDGYDINLTVFEGFSYTEGNCEDHKTHYVVKRDNGQEHTGERTVGFILLDYHEGSGRGGGCGDSSEGKYAGERELIGQEEMNDEEGDVNGYSSD